MAHARIEVARAERGVGAAVEEAHGYVGQRRGAREELRLDACARIDLHEPYLRGSGVAGVVDDAHLQTLRVDAGEIEGAYLEPGKGVGVVVTAYLEAVRPP